MASDVECFPTVVGGRIKGPLPSVSVDAIPSSSMTLIECFASLRHAKAGVLASENVKRQAARIKIADAIGASGPTRKAAYPR